MHRVFRAITTTALVSSKLTLVGVIVSLALFAVIAVRSFTPASALTTTPTTMNFQGRLLDSTGTPMPDGLYNMQFRLFTVVSGGSSVWNETRETTNRVQVTGGLFSTQLGQVTPLSASLFASGSLYFEITLPTPATSTCSTASCASWEAAMTPRNLLATSAYAYNAETLDGIDSTAFAAASGSANYIQNTTSPQTADFTITGVGTAATLQAATFDAATAGVLTIGGANASSISIVDDATLASGKTLRLAGDTRTNINAIGSPSEGMTTYDTTNKQLLTYANGKWQADSKEAVIVAASNSSDADKASADYVADGNTGAALDGDQVQINDALTAANPAGSGRKTGRVVLLAGTYTLDASISVPNNTTLSGVGQGTLITIPNSLNANFSAIVNTDTTTGTNVTLRDFKLDGNKANQSGSFGMVGVDFNNMGGGTGASARQGARITGVQSNNWYVSGGGSNCQVGAGICLRSSSNNTLTGNTVQGDTTGIYLSSSSNNTLTGNTVQGSDTGIQLSSSSNNTLTGNTVQGNINSHGIYLSSSSNNTLTGNTVQGNGDGIRLNSSSNNTLTGNTVQGNYYGINLTSSSSNNTLTGNTAQGNINFGINLSFSNTNTISSNSIHDSGGTTNEGINLISADYNTIVGNTITDTTCTSSCYAIDIANSASDKNYLEANRFSGSAANAATINDAGTGTIYAGQQTNSTTSTNSDVSDFRFRGSANSTTGFAIQNASGTSMLIVDTSTNNRIQVGSTTTDATAILFGLDSYNNGTDPTGYNGAMYYNTSTNKFRCYENSAWANCTASAANVIQNQNAGVQSSSNYWISGTGRADTALISPALRPASDGTTALQIQNASGTYLVNFDTTNMRIEIASGSDLKLAGSGNTRNALTKDFTCTSTEAVNDIVIISGTGTVGRAPGGSTLDINVAGVVVAKPATTTCTMAFSGVVQVYYGTSNNPTIGNPVVTSGSPGEAMTSSTPTAGSVIGHALSGKDGSDLGWVLLD